AEMEAGNVSLARSLHTESIDRSRDLDFKVGVTNSLIGFAAVMQREGDQGGAVQLLGAADGSRTRIGYHLGPLELTAFNAGIDRGRSSLEEAEFAVAWEYGASLTLDEAVELTAKVGS